MKNCDVYEEFELFRVIMAKGINAMYMFEWLVKKRRPLEFTPGGLLKQIILPVNEKTYKRFLKMERKFEEWFTLPFGAPPVLHRYFPDAEVDILKDGEVITYGKFPVLLITVFQQHLLRLLDRLNSARLIRPGKILRAVITDAGRDEAGVIRRYTGRPERGYDQFFVWMKGVDTGWRGGEK